MPARQRPRHTAKPAPRHAAPGLERLLITHPFHPLSGQRLEIEGEERPNGQVRFRCTGPAGTVVVPAEWTDQSVGAPHGCARLSYEALADLARVIAGVEQCHREST